VAREEATVFAILCGLLPDEIDGRVPSSSIKCASLPQHDKTRPSSAVLIILRFLLSVILAHLLPDGSVEGTGHRLTKSSSVSAPSSMDLRIRSRAPRRLARWEQAVALGKAHKFRLIVRTLDEAGSNCGVPFRSLASVTLKTGFIILGVAIR
jgi:hypothetical protein